MKLFEKFSNGLEKTAEWVGIILLLSVTIIVFIEVVARYGFQASSMLREELSRLLLCTFCFLSFGYIWKRGHHIMLDIIFNFFSTKVRKILWIFFHLLGLFISIVWLYCGIMAVKLELIFETVSDAGIPQISHYIILSLGMIFLIFHILEGLIKHIRNFSEKGT